MEGGWKLKTAAEGRAKEESGLLITRREADAAEWCPHLDSTQADVFPFLFFFFFS